MKFDKIGFIGLGLIGGSIAKKIHQLYPNTVLIAAAGHPDTLTQAFHEGLISNQAPLSIKEFADCDLIFLCAPVQKNLDYLKQLSPILKEGSFITDVGSTKGEIHRFASSLGLTASFIGGHPMTGSEKTGLSSSDPSILVNAYYIITPSPDTPGEDLQQFEAWIRSLGAIPLIMDADVHDQATGAISHLPHMIAFSLVNLVQKLDDRNETMKTIAAGGFKDITRIASSSARMWQNICFSNKEHLLSLMEQYMQMLKKLCGYIESSDENALLSFFSSAKDYRDSIAVPSSLRRDVVYEIYLDLEDNAGELAIIASILGAKGISIRNIGIINNREFQEGVLRIEFYEEEAVSQAADLLLQRGYKIYSR